MSFPTVPTSSDKHVFQILRPSSHRFSKPSKPLKPLKPSKPSKPSNPSNPIRSSAVDRDADRDAAHEPDHEASAQPSSAHPDKRHKVRQGSYESLGLSRALCAALHNAGYNFPTPIQRKAIPAILAGSDVIAMARTGSGKTAAYLAPLLHKLSTNPVPLSSSSRRNGPRLLVVSPTRELVLQQLRFCNLYTARLDPKPRVAVVVGGTPLDAQFDALAVCPDIIFATPGRLLQLLAEMSAKRALTLTTVEALVFDEADRLFEGTLAVETFALLQTMHNPSTDALHPHQTILVSATMPHALAEFSRTRLRNSLSVIRLDADRMLSPTMASAFLSVRADVDKDASLLVLARRLVQHSRSALVFAATHRRVDYLVDLLKASLHTPIACVHGNMDQMARQDAVSSFRKRRVSILVVTDVAARGIDLPQLDVVVNYDMPATPKLFVHRVGRVGRAGRFGTAVSLVTSDELPYLLDLHLFIGHTLTLAEASPIREDAWANPGLCMETSLLMGSLPKSVVDDDVEAVRALLDGVELAKLHDSARNAHKLYLKTRGAPSGESVRRAKTLLAELDACRKILHVHPWFGDLENEDEQRALNHVAKISTWRPKDCAVSAPASLVDRKIAAKTREAVERVRQAADEAVRASDEKMDDVVPIDVSGIVAGNEERTKSARVLAMEEERKQFFLPTRQSCTQRQTEKAFKAQSGGAMGDNLSAFRELNDAAMDVNADGNVDLLRAKHTGGTTSKYWDRVSKKFVKGGVGEKTSKQNLHVMSREARARAASGGKYSEDGAMFQRWLSKNRKAVEDLAERVEQGEDVGRTRGVGLGNNDYRSGAFGRKGRVATAGRNERNGAGAGAQNELKTVEEIRKSRKMKAKAEAKRVAMQRGKRAGKRQQAERKEGQRGASKVRVIVRRK